MTSYTHFFVIINCRCTFHLFTQEWQKKVSGKAVTEIGNLHLKTIKKWIDTLIRDVIFEFQFDDSVIRLKSYLLSVKHCIGVKAYNSIMDMLQKSMETCSTKWARCFRQNEMDLGQSTSSPGESMNHSMKAYSTKKLGSMTLSNSADVMINHSSYLDTKRVKYNSNDLNTSATTMVIPGLQLLTRYAEKQTEKSFSKRGNYYIVRVSQASWLVLHKNALNDGDDYDLPLESINDVHIAKYTVIYEVTVNTTWTEVQCSCKFKRQYGMPCVHMFAVNESWCSPKPRWFKSYNSHLYNDKPEIRFLLQEIRTSNDKNRNSCNISGTMMSTFHGVEYLNGSDEKKYQCM